MEKIKFGFGVVKSGQRNVSFEPEFSVLSSPGMFKITPQVSKALGVANGEYVMFINNRDAIDAAIREKDEVVVAFCEENGLDLEEPATLVAIHKEFDRWAIAKGVKMLTEKGLAQKASERLSKKQKEEYMTDLIHYHRKKMLHLLIDEDILSCKRMVPRNMEHVQASWLRLVF